MSVWRYTAVELGGAHASQRQRGEIAGESAAEVRASLRRIGLQVIDLRQTRTAARDAMGGLTGSVTGTLVSSARRYLRQRRRPERAELYDSLATMLDSGLPLLEAVDTVIVSTRRRRSPLRSMLVQVREELRSGSSLGQAMTRHHSWFDPSEVAMVRAGQHGGTLSDVLKTLAERHERSGELTNRLVGALAYPAIVALVGVGVVVFLSVKTLPNLTQILTDNGIAIPALTQRVMTLGQLLAGSWLLLLVGLLAALVGAVLAGELTRRLGVQPPAWVRRLHPKVFRRMAVARVTLQLSELLRTGVPMVEALRVLAPTTAAGGLRRRLESAADMLEGGEELSAALNDEHWFDPELRRLLDIGQASGELETLLERIGHRYTRQATRLIDRLTTLLEPAVILTLAVMVGLVVMAAILPLLRLQEIM